jgi:hypothetical protein
MIQQQAIDFEIRHDRLFHRIESLPAYKSTRTDARFNSKLKSKRSSAGIARIGGNGEKPFPACGKNTLQPPFTDAAEGQTPIPASEKSLAADQEKLAAGHD